MTPPERILLETDSPYLSPVPNRGKRNDSRNLLYIAQTSALWKNIAPEKLALNYPRKTENNCLELRFEHHGKEKRLYHHL